MKLMTVMCVVLLGVMFIAGCCDCPPTLIVYISGSGCGARTADMKPIETLVMYPGDQVVWVNTSNTEMTVRFEDESFFGEKEWTIAPGKRKIMTVQSGASGSQEYTIIPCDVTQWPGSPEAKVGEDP